MKFCLMINPADKWGETIQHAFSLAENMVTTNHEVMTVFFYGQAVKVIQNPELLRQWQLWKHNKNTHLLLCSTLVEKLQLNSMADQVEGFEVVSLGSWVDAIEAADKIVELS